jgi:hypothetical protein
MDNLFEEMWKDYLEMTPVAKKVVDLLKTEGEVIENDHIALRTFAHEKTGIEKLARPFLDRGYKEMGDYHFEQKKLYAKHYESDDPSKPKVFISELLIDQFDEHFQKLVEFLISQVPSDFFEDDSFLYKGRAWDISYAEFQSLADQSEYASWMAAHGYRPNHFTIFINKLKKFNDISKLNQFLKDNGVSLNSSGGEIKGSAELFLEQSSTIADHMKVNFRDGVFEVPTCYFEFAKRYPMKNGELYQGFVAGSADKIFESTDQK